MPSEFDFFQQWYPVSPVEDLDPRKPTPITLLGKSFVIWKSGSLSGRSASEHLSTENLVDAYTALKDECPHRLAPLSEGRIDDKSGNLMCSYHGWRFDETGRCQRIPQADNPTLLEENREHFCVTAFPCRVANDLVWIWPDAESADLAADKALPLSPQVDAEKGYVWSSMVRDLAYDWQTLVENVADPSHVPFAHHGVQGNRDRARPVPIEILTSTSDRIEAQTQGVFSSHITFEPPCRLEYALDFGKGRKVGLVTYCVPTAPGKSRIIAQFPRNFAKRLHYFTPRWFEHLKTRHKVLDGDMVLLNQQEKTLQARQQTESWKTAYRMPTSADGLVIEFRNWFDRYGQKYPWSALPAESPTRRAALDRYHQHTQICGSCRQALKQTKQLQLALIGVFAIALAITALLPNEVRLRLPLVILALAGLGAAAWLKLWLEPQFYFVDYIHAER
ncbi:MAG: Rieske 2Fe-2S domain-containing protein [Phormidesmis sp.]